MTRRQKLGIVGGILGVLIFSLVVFAATFLMTSFVYQQIGQQPSAFLGYIINTLVGLLLSFLLLSILGRVLGSKQRALQAGVFGPIIEAMAKIAKGDFSVRLENSTNDNGIVGALAKSVNDMALELDQMEQMRREFISNVSHELQSPLTSIRGFAQALQNDHLNPEDRTHYLRIIETECTRLSRITENLLKLASLEAELVRFEPKPYRLDKQIRSLILVFEPQWIYKQIEMDVSLEEFETVADEDLLSQVWVNLIHNGIKYTPPGGKICVDLHRRNGSIEFQIRDSGIGISEEDAVHVFERFYKVDKARSRSNDSGSGLGLSIAQKIVDMHQGTISLNSKPGVGTTFFVTLPAQHFE